MIETAKSLDSVNSVLYRRHKELQGVKASLVDATLPDCRPLYWARHYHVNTRLQRMSFKDLYYLLELYKVIDKTPYMVVEKSVQCFPAGTKVVTPFGYAPIEELDVGDLVLTHTGQYSPITKTFERKTNERLIERRADLMPKIRSTAEHPFFAYRYDRSKYHYSRRESVFGGGAEWVSAEDLKDGDFITRAKIPSSTGELEEVRVIETFDRPIIERDGNWFREKWGQRFTANKVNLDYGFGQLVGLYLAEGWINTDGSGRSQRLCFGFHSDEGNLEAIVRREIDRLYRGKDPVHTYVCSEDACRRVFVSSYPLVEAFRFWFGEGAEHKCLPLYWIAHAPSRFLRGVLDGALLGDGSRGKGAQSNYRSVSEVLVNQIRFIAAMHGIYGVIREEHPKGKRTVYSFVYSDARNRKYSRIQDIDDIHVALRVKNTRRVPFQGTVYNIEVAGDNSYVAEDYVVHNCGLSELFIIQSHIEAGERGMTVMYVLPKYELRNRFVNNRIYKLHKRTPQYGKFVIQAETKVHRTSLMHFGTGTLAYVGSNVQDEFIEIPVDSAYVDEKDRCNQSNLLMLPDRLTASPYKYQREISNPTVEGFGIDERYVESSQGKWHLKCPHCGEWFVPDFWKHVVREVGTNVFAPRDPDADPDPQAAADIRMICKCGKPVNRLEWGEWVHAFPGRQWQGFQVSKLFSKFTTLRALYRTWTKAVGNDLKTQIFYNSDLGLPFSSKGSKITMSMLDSCKRSYEWPVRTVSQSHARFMGVDVGDNLHVVIRERVRTTSGIVFRMVGAWIVPSFSAVSRLIQEWKPSCVVIDAMPEIHKVMELKEEFSMVWSSRFQSDAPTLVKHKDKREVRMDRTAILDYVRQAFELQQMVNPMQAEFIAEGEYYSHMQASTRILEANEDNPEKSRFIWKEGSRPDHFFLAEAYCMQAGLTMPDHGLFDFFDQESKALGSYGDKTEVEAPGLSDTERLRISELQHLTPSVFLAEQFNRNVNVNPPKPVVNEQRVEDVVKFMYESQGYVDISLVESSVTEGFEDIRRVLEKLGFRESKINGQYIK